MAQKADALRSIKTWGHIPEGSHKAGIIFLRESCENNDIMNSYIIVSSSIFLCLKEVEVCVMQSVHGPNSTKTIHTKSYRELANLESPQLNEGMLDLITRMLICVLPSRFSIIFYNVVHDGILFCMC